MTTAVLMPAGVAGTLAGCVTTMSKFTAPPALKADAVVHSIIGEANVHPAGTLNVNPLPNITLTSSVTLAPAGIGEPPASLAIVKRMVEVAVTAKVACAPVGCPTKLLSALMFPPAWMVRVLITGPLLAGTGSAMVATLSLLATAASNPVVPPPATTVPGILMSGRLVSTPVGFDATALDSTQVIFDAI